MYIKPGFVRLDKKPITNKQKSFIDVICKELNVEFTGTSQRDVIEFMKLYKKAYYRQIGIKKNEEINNEIYS